MTVCRSIVGSRCRTAVPRFREVGNWRIDRASDDPAGRSGPVHYRTKVQPLFEQYLYRPIARFVRALARLLQPIQSGDVNQYLLYILVVLIAAYLVYAW